MVGNHPVDGHRPRHGNGPRDCYLIYLMQPSKFGDLPMQGEHPRDSYFSCDEC